MSDEKDNLLKRILVICIIIYIVTLAYSFYINFKQQDMGAVGMSVVAIFTPLIVPIICKVCKFKPVYEIYIISTIFTYFASLVGSGFHWYSYTGFDKVLHFSSGWMFTTIAVLLYFYFKKSNQLKTKNEFHLFILCINAINLAIAVLWEFYEYAMLIFFNNDCINHYSQGVHDTMTDMLVAFVGGILLTLLIIRYHSSGKANFFTNVYEKFYTRNIAKIEKES